MRRFTPEEKELWKRIRPHLDGCKLHQDAPPEIVEAFKRWIELGQLFDCQ